MQRLLQRRRPTVADVEPASLVRLNAELAALRSAVDAGEIREAMRSYDGYVREAALFRCAELGEAGFLPAVVERLNDWVPQIRHAARSVTLELLPAADAPLAMSVLPDVQRLANASREDHSAWIARFEQALLDKLGAGALLDASRTADLKTGRSCFQLLFRHAAVDRRTLTETALHSCRDVVLAMQALHAFAPRAGEASPEAQGVYRLALGSKFGAVRAQALRWLLWGTAVEVDERTVVDALLDSHPGARGAAAFYLQRTGYDLRGHYRQAAADELSIKRRVTALQSLAHLRDADDLSFIRDFTRSKIAALRKAAWLGLLKVAPHERDAIALGMLRDDQHFVRAAALKLVRWQGAHVAQEAVIPILLAHGDFALLMLFIQRSKWSWLEWIARLDGDMPVDAPLRGMLATSLAEWAREAGSRFDRPNARQVEYLSSPGCRLVLERLAGGSAGVGRQLSIELDRLAQ